MVVAGAADAAKLALRANEPGRSLTEAAAGKRARYPPSRHPTVALVPFAVGALGRLSPEARGLVRALCCVRRPEIGAVDAALAWDLPILPAARAVLGRAARRGEGRREGVERRLAPSPALGEDWREL